MSSTYFKSSNVIVFVGNQGHQQPRQQQEKNSANGRLHDEAREGDNKEKRREEIDKVMKRR